MMKRDSYFKFHYINLFFKKKDNILYAVVDHSASDSDYRGAHNPKCFLQVNFYFYFPICST